MLYRPRPVVKKISRHKFKVTLYQEGLKWLMRMTIPHRAAAPNEKQVRRKLRRAFRQRSMSGPVSVYLINAEKIKRRMEGAKLTVCFTGGRGGALRVSFGAPKFGEIAKEIRRSPVGLLLDADLRISRLGAPVEE